jgi:hypothetical protein
MRRKLTPSLKLALRTNVEAIKANLMEFHGKTSIQANALVKPLETDTSEMALHEEPYVTAFELVRGNEVLPIELYREHRTRAVELWEKAKAQVMAGSRPVPQYKEYLVGLTAGRDKYAGTKAGKGAKMLRLKSARKSSGKVSQRKQLPVALTRGR